MRTRKYVGILFAFTALLPLIMPHTADAGIFRRGGGCGVGSSGCGVSQGCNVSQGNTSVQDDFAFKPINRPATTATVRTPPAPMQPAAPPQVVQGPKGDKGDPGQITQEHIDAISATVTAELLPQVLARLKTDDAFRGENGLAGKDGRDGRDGLDGKVDPAALAAAVANAMPNIDVNAIATAAAAKVDEDAIADKVAGKIDLAKIASMVKIDLPDNVVTATPATRDFVYITAKGDPKLESLDNQVYALKKAGVPIVVVRLDPRDTKVNDVPKLYDGNKRQTVSGHDNVVQYVSTLAVPTAK